MTKQWYKAVLAVVADGRTVTQVARDWDVTRQTVHVWLERYEADSLEGLSDRSHRPARCPHQMPADVEAQLLEMRRAKPYWGARRLALELARKRVQPAPSKSEVYHSIVRAGVIDPLQRQRRRETVVAIDGEARTEFDSEAPDLVLIGGLKLKTDRKVIKRIVPGGPYRMFFILSSKRLVAARALPGWTPSEAPGRKRWRFPFSIEIGS